MNEIDTDTEIQRITKPGVNLFAEIGCEAAEAERYQAEWAKADQWCTRLQRICPQLYCV